MNKRLKRYITKCIILFMMPAIAFLAGCGSDAQVDSSEIVENVEDDGVNVKYDEANANYDEVNANCDGVGTPEPEVLNESEESEINSESDTEPKLNPMEIYEGFLEGEIMIEKEKEQVYIDELFWDNDIEYCFADIDGDGSEELHIRDSVIYYVIKVKDEKLQIMFEGWWFYEPLVMGEQRGILFYFEYESGSERIEFIKINPDGSMESDGEYAWGDSNHNGSIDKEDYASADNEEIDAEQYAQYREEQIAKRAGNELEWMSRRLKNFTTWKEAYIDFINKLHVTEGYDRGGCEYSLIYVDDNDIPELYIFTGVMAGGEIVVSFYDGNIRAMNRDRVGIEYMEYGGLLYSMSGAMGYNPCNIYKLEKGEFSEIGTGHESEYQDDGIYFKYFWEGKEVTETEYEAYINELIDTSKCIKPPYVCSKDEILEMLTN